MRRVSGFTYIYIHTTGGGKKDEHKKQRAKKVKIKKGKNKKR